MAINRDRLELRFEQATGCTPTKAKKFTQQYIWLCALQMIRDNFTRQSGSRYYICLLYTSPSPRD